MVAGNDEVVVQAIGVGYVRLRLARLYRNGIEAARVERILGADRRTGAVWANVLTGSVWIGHDGALGVAEVLALLGLPPPAPCAAQRGRVPAGPLEAGQPALTGTAGGAPRRGGRAPVAAPRTRGNPVLAPPALNPAGPAGPTHPLHARPRARPARAGHPASPIHARDPAPSATLVRPAARAADGTAHPDSPVDGGPAGAAHSAGAEPWHAWPAEQVLARQHSDARSGLTEAQAVARLRLGANRIRPRPPPSAAALLLRQFSGWPVLLLVASALVSVLTGGLAEGVALGAVLVLNAGIGFGTERRAEQAIASLRELVGATSTVVRAGTVRQVDSAQVVPGDVLLLAPGVPVAADARVLAAAGLATDESALTGESEPAPKERAPVAAGAPLAERSSMVYAGTAVAAGTGTAVVTGTGADTELGRLDALLDTVIPPATPLQRQLDALGNRLVLLSLAGCAGVLAIGLLRGLPLAHMVRAALSLAIAAVPEGLPAVATTALVRDLLAMRRRGMLVRRLQAIETLGALHILCFDKTGTLTQNRMAAAAVHTLAGYHLPGQHAGWRAAAAAPALRRLLELCVLSNEASAGGGARADTATEHALVELARGAGLDPAALRARFPLLRAELRGAGQPAMRTEHALPGGARLVALKGSPPHVLAQCQAVQDGADQRPLTEALRAEIAAANTALAARALRVLGFGYALQEAAPDAPLVWLGMVGLADPVRPEAARAVAQLHAAGIRTAMITGDQRQTALAISRVLALSGAAAPVVVEAADLARPEARARAAHADVFARVSPQQKLDVLAALRQGGQVVGMVGDGINDGPALRAADVGIALGRQGTDLARAAADVVLMDDRLDVLLEAIRHGRTTRANIRKSLHFLISSNLSELLFVVGALGTVGATPLSPLQLLWINLLTDVVPAVALGAEPPEADVMRQPPVPPGPLVQASELGRQMREAAWLAGGALGAYLVGRGRGGAARAGALGFNALVTGQLLHALSCRSDRPLLGAARRGVRNPTLAWALAGAAALQLGAHALPGLRRLLGLPALDLADLATILAGGALPLLANEAAKPGWAPGAPRPVAPA